MGDLEAVGPAGDTTSITIAGQVFHVSTEDVREFAVGDYVVAAANGDAAPVIYHVGLPYVPGVSPTRVKGAVNSVDLPMGRFTVGDLTIDYTQLLSANPTFSPVLGEIVEVLGVQPASGSVLIIDSDGSVSVFADSVDASGAAGSRR
jgi:hypothetical protein